MELLYEQFTFMKVHTMYLYICTCLYNILCIIQYMKYMFFVFFGHRCINEIHFDDA